MRLWIVCVVFVGCAETPEPGNCKCEAMTSMSYDPVILTCWQSTLKSWTCSEDIPPDYCRLGPWNPQEVPLQIAGACDGPCKELDEATCLAESECGVARKRDEYYQRRPSFLACYEIEPDGGTAPCAGRSASSCRGASQCISLYTTQPTIRFAECVEVPRLAHHVIAARSTRFNPSIGNGCYMGSCIPNELCM